MTTTVLNQPRTLAATPRMPLLQRAWAGLLAMGAQRAAAELRRQAVMRHFTDPRVSRQMQMTAYELDSSI